MNMNSPGQGFALLCNPVGVIQEVLHNHTDLAGLRPGGRLRDLLGSGNHFKLLDFLAQLSTAGVVFDWEFALSQPEGSGLVWLSGALYGDRLMILGLAAPPDRLDLMRELMLISNEQTNELRILMKSSLAGGALAGDRDAELFDDLSRMNNELTWLQREIAKKNVELQAARDQLERRVQDRTLELEQANRALELAVHTRDQFLSAMSHELRTPLVGILGLADVLQMNLYGSLNEQQHKALRNIEKSGRRLLNVIDDVLTFTLLQTGSFTLVLESVALRSLCQNSLQAAANQAADKGLQLELQVTPDDLVMKADGQSLRQALGGLLDNAIKFTPKGGSIRLTAAGLAAQRQVRISVIDTGIGIAADDLPRLFQPFMQIDSRLARQYEGSGLGLVIVKGLIELHGGRVEVASVSGQGSMFTIVLPWEG